MDSGIVRRSDVRDFDDQQQAGKRIRLAPEANRKIFRRLAGIPTIRFY
jgi:hypothetical protein